MSLTAVSSYLNYRFVKLPKTIGLTIITLVLSFFIVVSGKFGWNVEEFAAHLLDGIGFHETFLHGTLGFLLFAASLHVNTMELSKYKTIVVLLATVSVILSTFMIGFGTYGLAQFLDISIPLEYCLVFGALISPTDPITALGILKSVNAPKGLEMKIAGEALFNDGMGIVLFVVLLGLAVGGENKWTVSRAMLFFLRQGIGGVLLGFVMGSLAARLLRAVDNSEVAISLTLGMVSGGYAFAHAVEVSAPICMAVAGLSVGNLLRDGNMSRHTLKRLNAFWELLDDVLNAILFVTIGLEFLSLSFSMDTAIVSVGAIIITMMARWLSVMLPVASVSMFRKFSPNVVLIMTWGGLRGGISIALALALPLGPTRDFILVITYAVVLFSIMVQGLTLGALVRRITKLKSFQDEYPNTKEKRAYRLSELPKKDTREDPLEDALE